MSDPNAQPGAEANPTPDPAIPEPKSDDKPAEAKSFDEAYVKKLRDEAAGYRTRLKEIEDANKTDEQRLKDELEQAQAKVKDYETREQIGKWKAEVAEATGIPAAALAGSTLEEITAHSETLKSLIPKKPGGPVVPGAGDTPPSKPADDERGFLRDLFGDK